MSRNPHATNLRHHKQQVIPDKRSLQRSAAFALMRWDIEDALKDALEGPGE